MTLAPLVKTVHVPLPPERAFDLFTRRMGEWWPLATHAVSPYTCNAPARAIEVPPQVGRQVVETQADGAAAVWGTVTAFTPGRLFAMTWHPGADPATATTVSVAFAAEAGGTRVTLTHSGWEHRTDPAAARRSYDTGWDGVLRDFAAALQGQAG